MNCRAVESKLSAFLDGELSGREMNALRDHCRVCTECAGELEALRFTKMSMQNLAEVGIPEGLLARLEAKIGSQAESSSYRRPVVSFALVAAAAALAALVVLNLAHPGKAQSSNATYAETVDFSRDQALLEAGDPLAGPAPVYLVGNGR